MLLSVDEPDLRLTPENMFFFDFTARLSSYTNWTFFVCFTLGLVSFDTFPYFKLLCSSYLLLSNSFVLTPGCIILSLSSLCIVSINLPTNYTITSTFLTFYFVLFTPRTFISHKYQSAVSRYTQNTIPFSSDHILPSD